MKELFNECRIAAMGVILPMAGMAITSAIILSAMVAVSIPMVWIILMIDG